MPENKKPIIEFAPGCFDNFDGTQEELDAMITEIQSMIESEDFVENSRELDEEEFNELPDDVKAKLASYILEEQPKRNLQ